MDTVFVVLENEPDNGEFPVVIKEIFATEKLADDYIAGLEADRDGEGEKTDEDLYWECEPRRVLTSIDEAEG